MSKRTVYGVLIVVPMLFAYILFAREAGMFQIKIPSIAYKIGGGVLIAAFLFFIGMRAGGDLAWRKANPKLEALCTAVGVKYDDEKRDTKLCVDASNKLVRFKADALAEKIRILEEHQKALDAKTAADAKRAATDAQKLRNAVSKMDKQDASVKNDQVGDDWFAALNELGGLRPQE